MKVALIHYWFVTRRGGDKVVEKILELYPDADIYTLFYDEGVYGSRLRGHKVYASILNNRFLRKHYQKIFPLYPLGIRSLRLKEDYDLVISSESGPAKGVKIKSKNTKHICYIHSPMRYCWGFTEEYLRNMSAVLKPIARFFFKRLREWDKTTIENVDVYVANSHNVAKRVNKYYNRKAKIVYPPIANELFEDEIKPVSNPEYYLSFGALAPYKRIDLLVEAFQGLDKKLVIIGDGSEKEYLQRIATPNVEILGALEWSKIESIFRNSKALLFPGEEDFGMIPLEVMAYGIPVIAYKKGGALETVIENEDPGKSTGLFFEDQTVESLKAALSKFEGISSRYDPYFIRNHAKNFAEDRFLSEFKDLVEEVV